MTQKTDKKYDLEERTYIFALNTALLCKKLPKNNVNIEYCKQLVRSSASVGANYIEANEALSKKDFVFRVKISRKEAKESAFWLRLLLSTNTDNFSDEIKKLLNESIELKKILSAILEKSK